MKESIRIVSTKKLPLALKQQMMSVNFSIVDEDYIAVQNKNVTIEIVNEYIIFTSKNAVESILLHKDIAEIKTKKCFCIGEKTKLLLWENGFEIEKHSDYAAELASIICNQYSKSSFTFFCGNLRKEILPEALLLAKIVFNEVVVYETILTPYKVNFSPNGVLFFSPSGVESYRKENQIDDEICFCIGNTTAEALKYVTPNIIIANQPTVESTIMKCIEYYKN
jgi:uroporphyrinogen-III synthase